MGLLHALAKTVPSFDDPHLVSHAGLVPVMALWERAGLVRRVVLVDCLIYLGFLVPGGDTPHHHRTVIYPLRPGRKGSL